MTKLKVDMKAELEKVPFVLCGAKSTSSSGGYGVTCKRCFSIARKRKKR